MELDREAPVVRELFARDFVADILTGTRYLPAAVVRAGARHLRRRQYAPHAPSSAASTPDAPVPASVPGSVPGSASEEEA
ncbi:hypothetical protein [Streptomyces sp. NBC_01506]|uniref:hypothetical protein n=1 Tax=Streptomyces sp. NBC_01506 TaxID=2903887 RepID=UPI0038708947